MRRANIRSALVVLLRVSCRLALIISRCRLRAVKFRVMQYDIKTYQALCVTIEVAAIFVSSDQTKFDTCKTSMARIKGCDLVAPGPALVKNDANLSTMVVKTETVRVLEPGHYVTSRAKHSRETRVKRVNGISSSLL